VSKDYGEKTMTDKELNERLWKIVKPLPPDLCDGICFKCKSPTGVCPSPDFTTDFNACLKWIMPVLREQGIEVVSYFYDSTPLIACDLCPCGASYSTIEGHGSTESFAFCMAADKFLKE
jgi:heterodisulfide reductase subunit C